MKLLIHLLQISSSYRVLHCKEQLHFVAALARNTVVFLDSCLSLDPLLNPLANLIYLSSKILRISSCLIFSTALVSHLDYSKSLTSAPPCTCSALTSLMTCPPWSLWSHLLPLFLLFCLLASHWPVMLLCQGFCICCSLCVAHFLTHSGHSNMTFSVTALSKVETFPQLSIPHAP